MTVKELEDALGMSRANIRYYEREGLLAPARLENGYRDYTGEDRTALEKIKLLRRLGLSVEDIRAVQMGQRELAAALRQREGALDWEAADLEAARTLCRRLEEEGVRYEAMDAGRYLEEMDRMSREGTRFPDLKQDALPTVGRPWCRLFARSLDMGLCGLLVSVVFFPLLRVPVHVANTLMIKLVTAYLGWGVLFALEPLLLSTWGYTPGKWLFGLKVRAADGRKLSFPAAFERLCGVFRAGEGYGIPFYNLYRNWKSYKACTDGEPLAWEEVLSYTSVGNRTALGGISYVAGQGVLLLLTALMIIVSSMPRTGMPLTAEGFVRGYHDVALAYDMEGAYRLSESGAWEQIGGVYSLNRKPEPVEFLLEDGVLTGLRLESHSFDFMSDGVDGRGVTAALTLLGSRKEVGVLNWLAVLREMPEEIYAGRENWSVEYYGVRMTNEVSYSGYEQIDSYLIPVDGEAQTYHRVLTLTLET